MGYLLLACAEPETLLVDWPDGLDVAAVLHRGEGQVDVLGVVAVDEGRVLGSSVSVLVEHEALERIELHGWTREELLERVPELAPESWSRIVVSTEATSCETGAVRPDGGWRIPLSTLAPRSFEWKSGPSEFSVISVDLRLLESLSLEVPLALTRCGATQPTQVEHLSESLLPTGSMVGGRVLRVPRDPDLTLREVLRLDPDRIVIQTYSTLLLIQRGRTFADTAPERVLATELPARPSAPTPNEGYALSGIAPARLDAEGRVLAIYASANHAGTRPPEPGGGAIFEIDIDAQGFVRPIRTSTAYDQGPGPGVIASLGDGAYVAAGSLGLIITKARDEAAVRFRSLEPRPWYRKVLVTPHPVLRHAVGSENGHLAVGDFEAAFEQVSNALLGELSTSVVSLAWATGMAPRLVVASHASGLWQMAPDRLVRRVGFSLDTTSGCASTPDPCGLRTLDRAQVAAGGDDLVVASPGRCGELLAIDLQRRCARSLPGALEKPTDLHFGFGLLTAVDEVGNIWELSFPPP